MSISKKQVLSVGVALLFCLGLGRAAKFRFQEKSEAAYKACTDQVKAQGGNRNALKAKYPTPEIQMVSNNVLAPGATGEIVVKGKFPPNTTFILENDNLEVVKEAQTATEYRATLKVAATAGPQTATVVAITPVTCIQARRDYAAIVCGKFEWSMDAANGWHVVARSPANKVCNSNSREDTYDLTFFRKGETKPFETRTGTLYYNGYDTANYRFSVGQAKPEGQTVSPEEMQALAMKLGDPKLTDAQRDDLMKRLEKIQAQMQTQMEATMKQMQDPSYPQKMEQQRQQFGCESIDLSLQGGALTGRMRCSDKVGAQLAITGTMKFLGQ